MDITDEAKLRQFGAANLIDWQLPYGLPQAGMLHAEVGGREMRDIARRLQARRPHLFPAVYDAKVYSFRSSGARLQPSRTGWLILMLGLACRRWQMCHGRETARSHLRRGCLARILPVQSSGRYLRMRTGYCGSSKCALSMTLRLKKMKPCIWPTGTWRRFRRSEASFQAVGFKSIGVSLNLPIRYAVHAGSSCAARGPVDSGGASARSSRVAQHVTYARLAAQGVSITTGADEAEPTGLSLKDTLDVWKLCEFETMLRAPPAWCEFFDARDARELELADDINTYWSKGPGVATNSRMACGLCPGPPRAFKRP